MKETIYSRSDPDGEDLQRRPIAGRSREAFKELFCTIKVTTAFSLSLLFFLTYPHVSCSYGGE